MGLFMFTARINSLIHMKLNTEYKLQKITKKLMDVQQYAAMVGKGEISIGDLLRSPSSMMGRSLGYFAWAHNNSLQYMQQNTPYMQQMYAQQMQQQNQMQQQQMMNFIQRSLYIQGRERMKEIETRNLNEEEKRITYEKEKCETLLSEINEELKSAKEARKQGIQDLAPHYTGLG